MLQPIRSLCVFLCVSSLFLVSEAQFFDSGASSLGNAPVGFISRVGVFGDRENLASLGNAPVGVYQRRQYPQPWYQVPRIPVVEVYPPAKPPVRPPVVRPPVVQPPVVRPPVKPACRLPGPCRDQGIKSVRPVRPPPVRPQYKPVVRPPVKPVVRPPVKPVVRPPVKPGVRPPKRPIITRVTRKPKPYRPRPKPGGVSGRSGGLLGGLLGGGLLGLG